MATQTSSSLQYNKKLLRVARRFYPHVVSLSEYIHMLNKHLSTTIVVRHSSDSTSYDRLLSSLLIGFPSHPTFPKNAMEGVPLQSVSVDDVLTQVISSTIRKHQNASKGPYQMNVLCNGFFFSKQDGSGSMFRDLDVRGPSTSTQQLRSRNFAILFSRIGYVVFRHILTEASLLLGVQERMLDSTSRTDTAIARFPSCALLQLCGPAAIPNQTLGGRIASNKEHEQNPSMDTSIVIKRDVMYRTPPSSTRLKILRNCESVSNRGLPATHHLQRLQPSLKNAEYLIRVIFPMCDRNTREIRTPESTSHGQGLVQDNVRRYDIITSSLLKSITMKDVTFRPIPPRLRGLARVLRDMLRRVRRYCFRRLLGLHCPLPVYFHWNETSTVRLLALYSNPMHVARYLHACVKKAFPPEAFGSSKNRGVIHKAIYHIVSKRHEKERFDIRVFISKEGFQVCDVPWLHRKGPNGHRTCNPTDLRFRTERIVEFITWVLKGFVIPLMNQSFYVTEADKHRYRLFHYRREVWTILHDRAEKQLYEENQQFEALSKVYFNICSRRQINVNSALSGSKSAVLLYHNIRFVPKKSSLRGIQRLRLKLFSPDFPRFKTTSMKRLYKQTRTVMNVAMRDFVRIMSREAEGNELNTGAAVFGLDDTYRKLVKAKNEWKQKGCPPLYACALDVKTSFDTIPLRKLFQDVVPHLFPKDRYVLLRYKLSLPHIATGRVFHRYLTHVCTKPGEETSFHSVVRTDLARAHAGGLLSDLVRIDTWRKDTICKLLSEALGNNIVAMSRRRQRTLRSSGFAVQRHGLPQGHPLSQLLTSLFYAYMEKRDLKEFLGDSETERKQEVIKEEEEDNKRNCVSKEAVALLMRLVDDTFFFSSSKAQANRFLRIMVEELRSNFYGVSINKEKAKTNFSTPFVSNAIQRFIPWCGVLIDTKNLEIRGDFATYKTEVGDRLRDAIIIEHDREPYRRMVERAFSCYSPKIHPLLFDRQINSHSTVVLNVYQSALLSCLKLCSHVLEIKPTNVQFFVSMVSTSVSKFVHLVSRCTTSFKARVQNCHFPCSIPELRYICTHAYYNGITRKLRSRTGMGQLAEASVESLQGSLKSIAKVLSSTSRTNTIPQLCNIIAAKECKCLWELRL